jgi:hypothetical protein
MGGNDPDGDREGERGTPSEAPSEERADSREGGGLDGLSLEAAVGAVVEDPTDSDAVREALAVVAEDGVVSRAAVDDAVGNATRAAATAEKRAELAATKLADVRTMAEPVSDLDVVAARLGSFDARLDRIEERLDTLDERLRRVVEHRNAANLYALGLEIRRVVATAEELGRAADEFQFDLDDFGTWLDDPGHRAEELVADADALAASLEELEGAVDALAADGTEPDDPAAEWAEASIRHRVTGLLAADLRAELATLRAWADREGAERPPDVEPRLDELASRREAVGERLAALADPAWRERFGDRLRGLERTVGTMEPPVAWGELEAVMERYRPDTE